MRWRLLHKGYLILIIASLALNANAQLKHERNTGKIARMYRETKADTNRVNVLLRWSAVLLDRQWKKPTDFDSAFMLANEAQSLSNNLNFKKGKEESAVLKGDYYLRTHNTHSFDSLMNVAAPGVHVKLLLKSISFNLSEQGNGIEGSDSIITLLRKAIVWMDKEKETVLVVRCILEIGEVHYRNDQMEKGAQQFLDALKYAREHNSKQGAELALTSFDYFLFTEKGPIFFKELIAYKNELTALYPTLVKEDDILDVQWALGEVANMLNLYYLHQGKTNDALDISMRTIKIIEANNRRLEIASLPDFLGRTFFSTEEYDLALKYCLMAFSIHSRNNEKVNGDIFKFIARSYVALNKPQEGIELMQKNVRLEDYDVMERVPVLSAFGDCYFALGNYAEAEKYYLEALRLGKTVSRIYEAIQCFPLGKLYIQTKQYRKGRFYLERTTTVVGMQMVPVWVKRDIQHLFFKADSATGDYLAAISHLNQFRVLNDSIFDTKRNQQIEELKIQFENDKKDADLKNKEQNIQLLTKQSELQQADLQQTRILRNSFIGGVIVLFLLLALTYNRYRLKQRTNKLLEDKQDKINLANNSLQNANEQLHRLLNEKEWLVKEIHHRVKNNLQIVVSLLNTQANHLPESEALTAIRESQQRMQVISLLHQRLYRMEESRLVNMKVYIRELTGYISESYKSSQHVYLVIETEDIFLDISQAVSIGLILNEAITNSYKYAFIEKQNGLIKISLEGTEESCLTLRISDNGNGLPSEFSLTTKTSMGMRLIETLSDQLDGELTIEGRNGVVITIQFKPIMNELKYERENINC